MSFSESELSDSDAELQDAFSKGKLKPGLNKLVEAPKQFVNNVVSKYSIKNVEEMDDGSTKNSEELAKEQEIKMYVKSVLKNLFQ
nr:probable rRNA-processing protein EBP2 [Leptinotarsa decemlineata]